jgi:cytochrome c-type biogenesis protein CcmH/NrfG
MASTGGETTPQRWTSMQAYIMAVVCLLVGFAVGYLLRGMTGGTAAAPAVATEQQPGAPASAEGGTAGQPRQPTPEELKAAADQQAAPLLEQLKSKPNDGPVLIHLGNLYYDAQQYPTAITYYQKALTVDPKNSSVRTDMATAMFYTAQFDQAIAEFDHALKDDPKNGNALFNRGICKWQGKMDVKGAVADWELLLKENPNYEQADQVRMYIAQAKKHLNIKPGQTTDAPAM